MKLLNYALVLLFTFGMLSCGGGGGGGSDSDEIAPTVTFTSPSSDASAPTKYTAGQSVVFKASLSDNETLKSITFTELAQPTKTVPQFISDFNGKLGSVKTKDAAVVGKSAATVDFSVEVLAGAPIGIYTVSCKVTDDSDNPKTVKLYFEIE